MSESIQARVVLVRPRQDGLFNVTLGTGRPDEILWFVTDEPPRLGERVRVDDVDASRAYVDHQGRRTHVTVIEGGSLRIITDPYARRVVGVGWLQRVQVVMRRPLYAYQVEGAAWIASRLVQRQGAILGDDAGVGKTAQAVAAIAATGSFPVIICCPVSVKGNWCREFSYCRFPLQIKVVEGAVGAISPSHVIIVNYELLRYRERQLASLGAKCLVFDEAHRIKEPRPKVTHRAAVATRLSRHIGRPILLTGTPVLNRPEDLWRLLHIAAPRQWPRFEDYRERYCRKPTREEQFRGVKHLVTDRGNISRIDELQALVDPLMLRRVKHDVLIDLPPKSRRSVLVDLEPFDRRHYAAAEKDIVEWLRALGSDQRATDAAKAQAIVKLTTLRRIAAVAKLRRAVPEYLGAWFDRETIVPLVIFSYHLDVLAGVERILKRLQIHYSRISGGDKSEVRDQAIAAFRTGKTHAFVAPIEAAGLGINLHDRCSDVLFLERMWTPALMNQAESRVERLGQRSPITATYLDAAGTVDEYVARVLETKQQLIDQVVDGQKLTVKHDKFETVSEVIEQLLKKRP